MLQRTTLSLLRSCLSGTAQLNSGFSQALGASCQLVSTTAYTAGSAPVPSSGPALPVLRQHAPLALMRKQANSLQLHHVRFAGDYQPEVPGNSVDNWASMRETYAKEKPSSLGANYYLNVLVMGFAYVLNDSYYFPSRTLWIGALVFFALYVRKGSFSTPLAFKTDY